MKTQFILNLFLLAFLSIEGTLGQHSEGKLFLLGGATDDSSFTIYNALRQATDQLFPKIAVVISAAPSLADGLDAYFVSEPNSKSYEQLFIDYGFRPSVLHLAIDNYNLANSNETSLGRENIEKIRDADIVFFNGGDQSRHARCWLNDDATDTEIMTVLRERFANGVVVAGTSAGLAIQGEKTFGGGTSYGYYYFNADLKPCNVGEGLDDDREGNNTFRYDYNGAHLPGFGFLTGALADSHFDARGRFVRMLAAMKNIGTDFGFGVDEDTAFYIENNVATVYGTWGVWVLDATEATFPSTGDYFNVESVSVAYLSEGDSYNLTSRSVISIKPIISSQSGNSYESNRIFSTDEALRSIKSLVSSRSTNSIGNSQEKPPTCRVVFEKVEQTRGYLVDGQYTIENLRLDVGTR